MTTVDADNLVTIKHVSMTSNVTVELDKITPGSEILLHLQVESHFPQGNIDLVPIKGQTISKANYGVINSPKKRTLG